MMVSGSRSSTPGDRIPDVQELRQLASIAVHGQQSVILTDNQLASGEPCDAWYPSLPPERPPLRMTLHTDSLMHAADETLRLRDWLVETGRQTFTSRRHPDIALEITHWRHGDAPIWAAGLPILGATVKSRFVQGLYAESLREDWDHVRRPDQPSAGMLDLKLHELQGRHVFVTTDTDLLDYGLRPQRGKKSFVIQPRLAQRYVDLYLKAHNEYRVWPNYSPNRGMYYWMRLWSLVPAFGAAWSFAVFGWEVAPRGAEIHDFMYALYARLMGMMQAHDRIGWLHYTPADNDTRDEMLNQLNYFIVLATGAFDSLAWLAAHRFQVAEERKNITVRAELPVGKVNPYFQKLAVVAPTLEAYLKDSGRQARIGLFYQPRDAIQHRLVLTGAHFNTGQYLSDCNVAFPDRDTVRAINAVDRPAAESAPFSEWGLAYADQDQSLLEPYRFIGTALKFVLDLVNGALVRLNFAEWLTPYPASKAAADGALAEGRDLNCPTFATPFP